jgi:uncharacterized protein YkvS
MNIGDRVQLTDGRTGVVEGMNPFSVYFGTIDGKRHVDQVDPNTCTVIPHPEIPDA